MTMKSILQTQQHILHLFLNNPSTRTPTIVLYVASFGGALHAAVTTFFYLSIGATTTEIGALGFIMSAGALLGSPLSGWALDRYGPWIPICVTAVCCAVGCLWRGVAEGLRALRAGAVLLGIGINLWTVVLAHLVKSFPSRMRSQVLAGFSVQMTVLQLFGKGVFPVIEYVLHSVMQIEEELSRYRIHMGLCTFFCFYGVVALFMDRKNVMRGSVGETCPTEYQHRVKKYEQKHSDYSTGTNNDDWEDDVLQQAGESSRVDECADEAIGATTTTTATASSNNNTNEEGSSSISSLSSFVNEPEEEIRPSTTNLIKQEATLMTLQNNKRKHLLTTATLTTALLVQSISTTFVTVLWPLLSKDLFKISAHTFGIITFISSIVSTGAVASFPIVERMERVGGRVRCAALGFGVGAVLCFLFCYCSFGGAFLGGVELEMLRSSTIQINEVIDSSGRILEGENASMHIQNIEIPKQLRSRNRLMMHAVSAIALQSALCFLEPSLKSILSLTVSSSKESRSKVSSLGFTMGYLTMLGNIGGMIGNIAGTWMYKVSTETTRIGQGGSLPFLVTGVLLSVTSVMIWRLDEPPTNTAAHRSSINDANNTSCNDTGGGIDLELGSSSVAENDALRSELVEGSDDERSDGCCVTLRETTYDLKLD